MTRQKPGTTTSLVGHLMVASVAVAMLLTAVPAAAQMNRPFHKDGWILAAAHAPGAGGSIWRTDLWVVARGNASNQKITLKFCKAELDNTSAVGFEIDNLGANSVTYIEDVVEHYLRIGEGNWLGAIHYTANDFVQVWARVYSISPDGRASFGQLVEGVPTTDMSPDNTPWESDDQQWLYALKHTADNRFRVNVGVVNPTAIASSYDVYIYTVKGELPTSGTKGLTITLPPFSMRQLSDPFASSDGGEWNNYRVRVNCRTEGCGSFAYASVVDNATNDGYFVRGVKRLPKM